MSRERRSKKPKRNSFRGEFSFVNKDASNIDSKEHNAHVSWHVVNRYERWKRQEQTKTLTEPVGSSENVTQMTSGPASAFVRKRRVHLVQGSLTDLQPTIEEGLFVSYPPSPWNVQSAEQSMLESSSIGTSYTHEQVSGHTPTAASSMLANEPSFDELQSQSTDNFERFLDSAQFPPLINKILAYSSETIIPTLWPDEKGRYKWQYEVSRTLEDLKAILMDPCYAAATLCFCATVMASITGDADVASQACFFQTQAMVELQKFVHPQPDGYSPFTLKSILRLFSAETALDNTSTARVHLKMLRNIVTLEGGVILLDAWFRENLLAADSYFALKYETRPLFPTSEWTPGPLSQPWKTRLASARITGDHIPTVDTAVDGILKGVILDLRELFLVQRYLFLYEVSIDDQLLRWRQLRKFDCLSRLADHQLSVKIYPHLFDRPKLQSAICAGIALLTGMVLGGPEPTRLGAKFVVELRNRLVEARAELDTESGGTAMTGRPHAGNVIYWLLHVGKLGEHCYSIPDANRWFESEGLMASAQLGLKTLAESVAVYKQILYSQTLIEEVRSERSKPRTGSITGVYEACGTSWRLPAIPTGN